MKPLTLVVALLLPFLIDTRLLAQDSPQLPDAGKVADKYLDAVAGKSQSISRDIDKQTANYLSKFQKEEARIYKKLAKKDSTGAACALVASKKQYAELQQKLATTSQTITTKTKRYIPLLDTLSTSLKFLRQYGDLFKKGIAASQQLNVATAQVNRVEDKLQQADDVQAFINERQRQLTQQLQQAGMSDALKPFTKNVYYYSARIKEYRDVLSDPDKAEQKAIALLNQLPAFQQFIKQNSLLAALFNVPGSNLSSATALQGLQTRASVQQLIQNQISSGGPNAQSMIQQNIQAAQAQLTTLKDKLSQLGGSGSSDMALPDFKPNQQKTKTFLQRLEYGGDIQSSKAGYFFPVTSDIALSLGYKLNNKSVIGIGAAYKLGWGSNWNNIKLSHQGVGLRSYLDWKIKGSFYFSGGYEQNYRSMINSVSQLYNYSAWQTSGLVGVSKKYNISKKMKGEMKLLWDFMSYQQVPKSQPILFRVGYSLK